MLRCPHCNSVAVKNLAARWARREAPATCGHCGKLSHVIASTRSGMTAYNLWAWRRVELFPISPESAQVAARVGWWLLAIAALLRIFSS
jgi:hypothetical protein